MYVCMCNMSPVLPSMPLLIGPMSQSHPNRQTVRSRPLCALLVVLSSTVYTFIRITRYYT